MTYTKQPKRVEKKCLNCAKKPTPTFHPFCSTRCSQLDLSKWLKEDYRVPVVEIDDFDEGVFLDEDD